jgi:DNA-binding MarR family transcriptional regulator
VADALEVPDDELVDAIVTASRALVAIAARSLESSPIDVTLSQFRALVLLSVRDAMRMSEVGLELGLLPSSTTRLVERLERKALVERQPSPASRRSIVLHLTPLGAEVVDGVMAVRRREIADVVARIPASRRASLRAGFERFAAASGEPTSLDAPLGRRRVPDQGAPTVSDGASPSHEPGPGTSTSSTV